MKKNVKSIKYLSISLILSGFAVSATRGALTQDSSIAQEVAPEQTASATMVNQEVKTDMVDMVNTPTKKIVLEGDQVVEETPAKSEVVFAAPEITEKTEQVVTTSSAPVENQQINQEVKQEEQVQEQKPEEVMVQETVVKEEPAKQQNDVVASTESEEVVFNPEEKIESEVNTDQVSDKVNVQDQAAIDLKNQMEEAKTLDEQSTTEPKLDLKKPSAAKDILKEDSNNQEKLLEDQGLNSYYIEDKELPKEGVEEIIESEEDSDSAHLIG